MWMVLVAPVFAAVFLSAALIGRAAPPGIAAVHRHAVGYQVVYSFRGGQDGRLPQAGLVDDAGILYGTTFGGGSANLGTVFAVSPTTGVEQVVHAFASGRDAQHLIAGLTQARGTLYGTTYSGGAANSGAVFSVQPSGTERVVYGFPKAAKGANPAAGLVNAGGVLYGTTGGGGTSGLGTVFSIDASGHYRVVHDFTGSPDGANPAAGLIDVGGTLYGSTSGGGAAKCAESPQGCGIIFSISPAGSESVVYQFLGGADGAFPSALLNAGTALVGTTQRGGIGELGTVFAITTAGVKTIIHDFGIPPDGALPAGGLIEAGGIFYGTTLVGGGYGKGAAYSVTASGTETVLHSFGQSTDGYGPDAPLLAVGSTLYGTTQYGGPNACGCGTVFALTP